MPRYMLQTSCKTNKDLWIDSDVYFNTKKQLEEFIGTYGVDYDWRVGYTFKHYGRPMSRFVWVKTGEEVKV